MTDSSNSTTPWVPPTCSQENWSNGSALSVLFAFAVGCLAHPRGSLTFNKSGRIWRLSPHLGFVEAVNLVSKLLVGLMRGYSLHVTCVTLLTVRAGNSWTSTEYDSYEAAREKESTDSTGHHVSTDLVEMRVVLGAEERQPENEDVIPSVGRSATIEAEEGRANVNLYRRTNRDPGPHNGDTNEIESRNETSANGDARKASEDSIFLFQLKETERYESGLTFRLLVWVPMLLAALKIMSVTGGWSILGPKLCGCMFFCSWLVAELITIAASRRQLSKRQQDKALKLSRLWRKSREEEKNSIEAALMDPRSLLWFWEIEGPFILGRVSCTILLGFNAWPLVAKTALVYFSPYWRYYIWMDSFLWQPDWSFTRQQWMSPIEISIIYVFVLMPFLFYAVAYFGLIYLVLSPWAMLMLTLLLVFLASCCGVPEQIVFCWYYATKMADANGLVPGYLALVQVVLTIFRYTRVLNDYASYDCSTTTQVSWYDWTG